MTDHILYECEQNIGILTLNRPEKRNAMTGEMISTLLERIREIGEKGEAHVLIITGSGGTFCAGVDLKEVAKTSNGDAGLPDRVEDRHLWWPAVECSIPVIAAVDGMAVGMGAEFTCHCDIRIGTPSTKFTWNFARRGLVPDSGAGTWLLPRLIGVPRTLKLLFTGDWLEAEEALACGYLDKIVPAGTLLSEAKILARKICKSSLFSTRKIKRLVYDGLELQRDLHITRSKAALEACFQSQDHIEGIAAFLENREARFTGR